MCARRRQPFGPELFPRVRVFVRAGAGHGCHQSDAAHHGQRDPPPSSTAAGASRRRRWTTALHRCGAPRPRAGVTPSAMMPPVARPRRPPAPRRPCRASLLFRLPDPQDTGRRNCRRSCDYPSVAIGPRLRPGPGGEMRGIVHLGGGEVVVTTTSRSARRARPSGREDHARACAPATSRARRHDPVPHAVVCGHEGAGIVDAVERGLRSRAGDHVVVSPFANCGRCPACAAGLPDALPRVDREHHAAFTFRGEPAYNFAATTSFAERIASRRCRRCRIARDVRHLGMPRSRAE